ncbi:GntR family transcriptional regulator [Streptomyces rapamycinicus]|uniref:GntR family transcriptional regulator n=2 Tax=Streptomyces TaxID=1883 RepID=A0A0A0N9U7_STRRN|nr:GntR family transcriptional regulator [Streptomyces rapamycinicus]AGP56217.1 GntR family transcriptional regulator [Streptomyces rapamycinicus NRRL 5491]RLV80701.1 GntR family transcriptional regulator [Streptomyces rapamycinicus NRRL 5491]UTO64184.1 GntR family transcriptional regulator [Streptomyces rapamycinicus]UTP32139.1 GntR family transcriptional regulator [Streptomyces rapamycinicus NRRL 5491]
MASLTSVLGVLDPTSDRAVFRQIADALREAIDKGRFREGDKLPSETELVDHFGVSRMTVRNSLSLLQQEGLAVSEHGKGVFVRPRPPVRRLASDRFARRHRDQGKAAFTVEAEAAGSRPEVDNLEVKEERPSPDISARLGSPRKVLARRRRYLLDGRPVEFATSYLPLDLARNTPIAQPNPGPGGIYARLEEMGHRLDHFDEEIRARMPSPAEVRTLQLASGVPVIHLVRTAFDSEGRAVEVCDTVMAADAYVLAYQLPAN